MARPFHASGQDSSGSVAVTVVMMLSVVFGMAAIAVDGSRLYLAKRSQQGTTDLAAVAAAANIAQAQAAAAASLAANGVPAANLVSVELGTYAADPTVAAPQRFTVGGTNPNAARVTLRSTPSTAFGALMGTASVTVGTRSVAVNANVAAFALGSTTAGVDSGTLNAILGGLAGSPLNLQALDYAGLASANVDLFGIANALAVRIGATGSYASLAATAVRLADVINAAADAVSKAGGPASAVSALRAIATGIGPSGPTFTFGSLVAFGAYGTLAVGSPPPVTASLPLLPLVAAAARIGGGANEVSTGLPVGGGTIAGASVKIALGEPTAGSSYAAIGPVGTTLHTAQTRVLLTLQLALPGNLAGVTLPLYVEVGSATATLSAIGCSAGAPVDPVATLSVTPGALDAWIGTVSDAMLTNMTSAVSPSAAVLTSAQLLLTTTSTLGRAHVQVANGGATSVPFTQADIAAGTMKSTSTADGTSTLLSQLFRSLQLSTTQTTLGITIGVAAPTLTSLAIGTLLGQNPPAIDAELSNTLAALGVTVGDADTWVRAVRCGQGAVVN